MCDIEKDYYISQTEDKVPFFLALHQPAKGKKWAHTPKKQSNL